MKHRRYTWTLYRHGEWVNRYEFTGTSKNARHIQERPAHPPRRHPPARRGGLVPLPAQVNPAYLTTEISPTQTNNTY
jgi:hypothetical protein